MAVRQIEPIDRAELRATIQKWIDAHTDVDDTDGVGLLEDVLWEINAQPTLTPPNEWVSVEERLPEHMKDVIVLYGSGEIDIDWVDSLGDFRFDNLFGRVTHWMPLPAPPRKGEQP